MKNKKSAECFYLIAVLAVFGMMFTACEFFGGPNNDKPKNDLIVINIAGIKGVTAPKTGGIPVTKIGETMQYTGLVKWEPDDAVFKERPVYTATITLKPKKGFTLKGVAENFFEVAGASSVSNAANSGVIRAVFPGLIPDPIWFLDLRDTVKTYGDEAFNNAIYPSHQGYGAISYSSDNETVATVDRDGTVTIHKTGTAVITARKAADEVFASASCSYTLTVEPKELTVSGLGAADKIYDRTTTATITGEAVIDGLINDDDVTTNGTAAFESAAAGDDKTVTFNFSLGGAGAGNYTLSAQPESVTANITVKPVTITGLGAADKIYDYTADAEITGKAVIDGLITGDDVTVISGTAFFENSDVGENKTVTFSDFSLDGAGAGNYTLSAQPASVKANITPLNTPDPIAFSDTEPLIFKTYGDAAFTNAITNAHSGWGAITYSSENETVATVNSGGIVTMYKSGTTVITARKPADAMYAAASQSYTLTVGQKAVTISGLGAADKVYDGTTTATRTGTAAITGLINSDTVTVNYGTAVFASAAAGNNKTVTFSGFSLGGASAGNYSLSAQPADVTANITAKPVTITGLTADKVYDGTATMTPGGGTINGKIGGDAVTINYGTAAFESTAADNNKTVTFSGFSLGGAAAGNYSLPAQPASITANITAKPVTITGLGAADKVYDGSVFALRTGTATINGLVSGDDVAVSGSAANFASPDVGTNITVTFSGFLLYGADAGNYFLSAQPASVTANITVKHVKIIGVTADKIYDGTATMIPTGGQIQDLNGSYVGSAISIKVGIATFESPDLGINKPVTFSGFSLSGATADNYFLSEQPASTRGTIRLFDQVFVQNGTFQMGSPESEPGRFGFETQHQVTLSSFYIGKYQITQAQYEMVMGTNPSHFTTPVLPETSTANRPVEQVNWYDAIVFCNKLSLLEGLTPAYRRPYVESANPDDWGPVPASDSDPWWYLEIDENSKGYRLPTEAQWEFACRSRTSTTAFRGGNTINSNQANYNAESVDENNIVAGTYLRRTTGVGSYAPNALVLYDMHGNVSEWCWDLWEGNYGGEAGAAATNPTGADPENPDPAAPHWRSHRVLRGGSWMSQGRSLRSATRGSSYTTVRLSYNGFRLVRPY